MTGGLRHARHRPAAAQGHDRDAHPGRHRRRRAVRLRDRPAPSRAERRCLRTVRGFALSGPLSAGSGRRGEGGVGGGAAWPSRGAASAVVVAVTTSYSRQASWKPPNWNDIDSSEQPDTAGLGKQLGLSNSRTQELGSPFAGSQVFRVIGFPAGAEPRLLLVERGHYCTPGFPPKSV